MTALLEKIHIDPLVGELNHKCQFAALASICGMKLPESDWKDLGYHDTTPYAILEQVEHLYRLLISPAVLAKSKRDLTLPIPFGKFLSNPLPNPDVLSLLWKNVVASRFSAVLSIKRKLRYSSITLKDLLGPNFYPIVDDAGHFHSTFRLPASDGIVGDMSPLFRNSTNAEGSIEPIMGNLKAFVTKEKIVPMNFTGMAIGMFNTEPRKKHPLADIVVALEQNPFKVLLMFVSVKGPEEIAVSGSRLLSKRKVQGDIKALRQARRELRAELNSPDATYRVSLSLVYVLSKEQTEKELEKFRDV
eukprot:gene3670-4580_t